jgi:hypothetical protein
MENEKTECKDAENEWTGSVWQEDGSGGGSITKEHVPAV